MTKVAIVSKTGYREQDKWIVEMTKLDRRSRVVQSLSWGHQNNKLKVKYTFQRLVNWSRNYSKVPNAIDDGL